jgi:hypothetical protein
MLTTRRNRDPRGPCAKTLGAIVRRTLRVAAAIVALTAATVVGSAPASASPFYAVTLNTSTVHPAENGAAVLTAGSNIDVGQT